MEFEIFGRQIYVRKGVVISTAIIIALILGGIGYVFKNKGGEIIGSNESSPVMYTKHDDTTIKGDTLTENKKLPEIATEIEEIKVYVVGCVNKAGVVTLEKGQIIEDAIKAAGGATKEADLENINLAYELNENTMLKIYSKRETISNLKNSQEQTGNKTEKVSGNAMAGVKIIKDSGGAVLINSTEAVAETVEKNGKININTASAAELDKLTGVGEKTASDIISYRQKSGGFKKIEDIMNVPRIGESRFNQMKEQITVK